jgi:hypothetical protein
LPASSPRRKTLSPPPRGPPLSLWRAILDPPSWTPSTQFSRAMRLRNGTTASRQLPAAQAIPRNGNGLDQASSWEHDQNHHPLGEAVAPAPLYRPLASSVPTSEAQASQPENNGSDSDNDDILALLGIGSSRPPKPAKSRVDNFSNLEIVEDRGEKGRPGSGEVLARAGSGSSLGSNSAAESEIRKSLCSICNKDTLYPKCLREGCNKICATLVRVYTK